MFDDRVLVTGAYNWLAYRKRTVVMISSSTIAAQTSRRIKIRFTNYLPKLEAVPLAVIQAEAKREKAAVAPVAAAAAPASAKQVVQDDLEEDEADDKNPQKSV